MGSAALTEAAKSIRDWSLSNRTSSTPAVRAAEVFGSLVFNDKLQQERLPKPAYRALRATITRGEALDPAIANTVATRHEGLGHRARRHALLATGSSRSPARRPRSTTLPRPRRRRRRHRRVSGKRADPGRARCVELPLRRHPRHLSKRAATPRGTPPAPPFILDNGNAVTLCIPTAFVSGPAKPSTRRRRCFARSTPSPSRRCAS